MTFNEAKAKLKEISGGAYHAISYEVSEFADGKQRVACKIYIDGKGFIPEGGAAYPTWQQVFTMYDAKYNSAPADESAAPEGDVL
jgi:hypothetical protein